jgi:hypothetical protein
MNSKTKGNILTGLILMAVGGVALLFQFMPDVFGDNLGRFLLLGLGLIFVVVGIATREGGWFIPGGILTGLGTGVLLVESPLAARLGGDEGGWFLLAFAGGWFLIPLLTAIFAEETHWWALIPGGIIALVGLAVLYGGLFESVLEWAGKLWPLALIIGGIALLWKARRPAADESEKQVEKHA